MAREVYDSLPSTHAIQIVQMVRIVMYDNINNLLCTEQRPCITNLHSTNFISVVVYRPATLVFTHAPLFVAPP